MKVQTKWFGEIDTSEDKIITFEKGIIGFESYKKYMIVFDAQKEAESSLEKNIIDSIMKVANKKK